MSNPDPARISTRGPTPARAPSSIAAIKVLPVVKATRIAGDSVGTAVAGGIGCQAIAGRTTTTATGSITRTTTAAPTATIAGTTAIGGTGPAAAGSSIR